VFRNLVVAQLDCHPEQSVFAQRGIWAGRAKLPAMSKRSAPKGSRFLRSNNRAFGSLPYQTEPLRDIWNQWPLTFFV